MYHYTVERRDTLNFHGWVILEHDDGCIISTYYQSTSLEEIKEVMKDLRE